MGQIIEGQTYRKNGKLFQVHFLRGEEVYGVVQPDGMTREQAIEADQAVAVRGPVSDLADAELVESGGVTE